MAVLVYLGLIAPLVLASSDPELDACAPLLDTPLSEYMQPILQMAPNKKYVLVDVPMAANVMIYLDGMPQVKFATFSEDKSQVLIVSDFVLAVADANTGIRKMVFEWDEPIENAFFDPRGDAVLVQIAGNYRRIEIAPDVETRLQMFRQEVWQASINDSQQPRAYASISVIRGNEAQAIPASAFYGDHIISLGSGPDIFRPLHDFPTAKHFHLVDSMLGWGNSPQAVVDEFYARLKALGRDVQIEVLQLGFIEQLDASTLDDLDAYKMHFNSTQIEELQPLTVQAKWTSAAGSQSKTFSLHVSNYLESNSLRAVLARIGSEDRLGAILITGAPVPAPETTLDILVARLKPGGYFVAELFKKPDGEFAMISDAELTSNLGSRFSSKTLQSVELQNARFQPLVFLAIKKD